MRIISLTSVPPRFGGLGPVLETLTAQGADMVILALPVRYTRFSGPVTPPPLPEGVTLLRSASDHGPMTKLLPARAAYPDAHIAICDDDCLYDPGWFDALWATGGPGAVAGSTFPVSRLGRAGGLVAQGFAGVLLPPCVSFDAPPSRCHMADDLWISACLAQAGVPITPCPAARNRVRAFAAPAPLQNENRAGIYARAAHCIHETTGLWPPLT